MNSVFELLIKVWMGSRDLKVRVSLGSDSIVLFLACFFHTPWKQCSVSTDRSIRTREGERILIT